MTRLGLLVLAAVAEGPRKGAPLANLPGRVWMRDTTIPRQDVVAAAHRLVADGYLFWSTVASRAGGDRYNLLKLTWQGTEALHPRTHPEPRETTETIL